MNLNLIFLLCLSLWMINLEHVSAQSGGISPEERPNIVLIYIDDLGYSDIGTYGKENGADFIETPNIDQFADRSIKFTRAYTAAPICSPARAALLTGKTPARLQFEFVTKWPEDKYQWNDTAWTNRYSAVPLVPPPYPLNLPLSETTIAEALQEAGYHTAMAGKWHVSTHYKVYNGWNPDFGPDKQGFEWTADTFGAFKNRKKAERNNAKYGAYPPDSLTSKAIEYIRQTHDAPFFMYLSHYYVHTPIDKHLTWLIDKYRNKAKKRGLVVSEDRIRYAAFVETMDYYVGEVLDAIADAELNENTMVIFTSDNGGMPEFAYNRPFRGSKWNLYEGGIRIPMLIHYPGSTLNGTVSDVPITQMDFLPTFYEIATGRTYPDKEIDGGSFLSLFTGNPNKKLENRTFYWHFPYYHPEGDKFEKAKKPIGTEDQYISQTRPQSAIKQDGYKLIYFYEDDRSELYDLASDPQEQHSLNEIKPRLSRSLKKQLFNYLRKVDARLPKTHAELSENTR